MQSVQPTHEPITSMRAPLGGPGRAVGDSSDKELAAVCEAEFAARGVRGYRPALAASELITEIRGLLAAERRAERLVCRYLADLADRIQARQDVELGGYVDEFDAARHCFGLGARETRERVRIGRALRRLPRIERAFIEGELSYSRVREVTRVATVHTEVDWLELARSLGMRSLERRVAEREAAGARSGRRDERRVGQSARAEWIGPETVRVTFELSTEAWTLLDRAMREARRVSGAGASDGDALEAVARASLAVPRGDISYGETRGLGMVARGSGARELAGEVTQGGSADECEQDEVRRREAWQKSGSEVRAVPSGESMDGRIDDEPVAIGSIDDEPVAIGSIDDEPVAIKSIEQACEPASRLLHVMGRSRGWTTDALAQASGLSAREVCVALTLLEIGGRVRQRAFAFDPV